jgi:stearoyl-CoA desaturase (Delta-9 desaturase)
MNAGVPVDVQEIPDKKDPVGVSYGGLPALKKRFDNALLIGIPFAGTIAAPFWVVRHGMSWIEATAFVVTYAFVGFGVGLGLHRYFSHRSFRPKRWMAILLGAAGSMAFQGSILRWVADHRRHHAHTDDCGDTHSPALTAHCEQTSTLRGLWNAHIGWMFDNSVTDYEVFGKDLLKDQVVMYFHRTHWIWPLLLLAFVAGYGYLLGGPEHSIGCLLVAGCLRTTIFHNIVWAVNSIGHTYGYQSYPQQNRSRNNLALAMLTFGDGWHNNHHQFPRSAFHGLTPNELDINGLIIRLLEGLGLVQDVVRIAPEIMNKARTPA